MSLPKTEVPECCGVGRAGTGRHAGVPQHSLPACASARAGSGGGFPSCLSRTRRFLLKPLLRPPLSLKNLTEVPECWLPPLQLAPPGLLLLDSE